MTQHVQVPHMSLKDRGVKFIDPYVYACIRRHANADPKGCFPSVSTLSKESGLSRETIIESVNRLNEAKFIETRKVFGQSTIYYFSEYEHFEIFSYEFLDREDLTPKEKAYLIATQQFMFKHPETGQGTITYSNKELADLIGISYNTLLKYETSLKNKQILTFLPTQLKDQESGLPIQERVFEFQKFANLVAFEFQKVEIDIEYLKKQDEIKDRRIAELERQIKKLTESEQAIIL